jgi:hypothetical protein
MAQPRGNSWRCKLCKFVGNEKKRNYVQPVVNAKYQGRYEGKGKGKFYPGASHEGPEEE